MPHDICFADTALDAEALADWNAMTLAFLAHGRETPVRLAAVMERAPDFAMGHAARGLFSLLLGRREMVETARAARNAAGQARTKGSLTARQAGWCAALEQWLDEGPAAALPPLDAVLADHPEDTLTVKLVHAIRFILGDAPGMRASLERSLPAHGPDHPCRGYLLGCLAFALEETGDYRAAERAGYDGLALATDDAWGLHAVAHVYDMTGRPDRGIALIEEKSGAWLQANNFRYHVWWHKALLHLDRGDIAEVLALYDARIRIDKTDDYRDIANATSLLMRLELEGVAVGDRWAELADLAERRTEDACLVFADLHYMLALTGDRREDAATRLLSRIRQDAQRGTGMARILADPGIGTAAGLAAFGDGQYERAFAHLFAARPRLQAVGGSHAQRDVFERVTVDAGLRAGRFDEVGLILSERRARRAGAEDAFAASRRAALDAALREVPRRVAH
jgi:tetratricopeptide (TPR) repeat protein